MTLRKLYIGSVGPIVYDDTDLVDDPDGDFVGETLKAVLTNGDSILGSGQTITFANTGLHILDSNSSHDLILIVGSDLTADRNLTITTGDAARTVTLSGNPTLADWFDQAVKAASTVTFGEIIDNGLTASLLVETDGSKQLTSVSKQAHIADAAVQDLTGSDTVDQTKLEADLASCKDAINAILVALETAKVLNTS